MERREDADGSQPASSTLPGHASPGTLTVRTPTTTGNRAKPLIAYILFNALFLFNLIIV